MTRLVILDNEAIQALMSADHPKHRRALAHVQVVGARKKKAVALELMVPTAVRTEAGWNRRAPHAAFINLLGIRDAPLDTATADEAASIVSAHGVSVADAHIGALVRSRRQPAVIAVLTSDPDDIRTVTGAQDITVVRL